MDINIHVHKHYTGKKEILAAIWELNRLIMATQQEFDEKIRLANEKLDAVGEGITNVQTAVTNEGQQIRDFIAGLPPAVDTSAIDGVLGRLDSAAAVAGQLAAAVTGIFEPAPDGPGDGSEGG